MKQNRAVIYSLAVEDPLGLPCPPKLATWALCLVPSKFDLGAMLPCSGVWCASIAQSLGGLELVQRPLTRGGEWLVAFKVNKPDGLTYALSEDLDQQKRHRLIVEWSAMLVPSGEDWKRLLSQWWDASTHRVPWWRPVCGVEFSWQKVWRDFVTTHLVSLFYHDTFNDDFWIFANPDRANEIDQSVRKACNTFGVQYRKRRHWRFILW